MPSMQTTAPGAILVPTRASGAALMIGGGVLLGTIGVFLEQAGQDPLTAVWFRCAFGALALSAWMIAARRYGELRLAPRALLAAVAAGVLMVANWALFFAAIERTSIAVATVVFHVQPFWVMALGAVFLGERVRRRQWVAAGVALCGLALASGLAFGDLAALDARFVAGLLMCLGGSLSYAVVTLIARGVRSVSPLALAWWQCVVGAAALAWWPATQGLPAIGPAWVWLAGLGVVHTGLAYVVLYAGMARLTAGRIAVLQFVYPATAVLVDALAYGRVLSAAQLGGVALMLIGLLAATRSPAGAPVRA
jgi:RarD protein